MINIAIFGSGEGSNAEQLIKHFSGSSLVKIKIIVSNKETSGLAAKAKLYKKNLQIVSKEALVNYADQLIDFLKAEKVDLIVLAGFLIKIPDSMVSAFPNRIINIHPSLLPKYGGKGMYGMHVHEAVLAAKEKESGITIHFVNEEFDKGKIVFQKALAINENETPESLALRVRELEHACFPKVIEELSRSINDVYK